jgi:hypothetical protein
VRNKGEEGQVRETLTAQEAAAIAGTSTAQMSKIARQNGMTVSYRKCPDGPPRTVYLRAEVEAWAAAHGCIVQRHADFIAMRDWADGLEEKPSAAEMMSAARFPFSWYDIKSLIETRTYRGKAAIA